MAVIANTQQTYATKGIREDLSDVIYNIAPIDTPFMSSIKKSKASSSFVEWQTQDLASVTPNAQIEGDDVSTFNAVTPTVRLGNYTQISTKPIILSGTVQAVKAAGRADELGYQVSLKAKELKRDQESALTCAANGQAGALSNCTTSALHAGGASAASILRGIEGWVTANTNLGATGVAPVSTMGSWTAGTAGTARALTETLFLDAAQKAYDAGGEPDMVLMTSKQRSVFNGFTGNTTKFNSMEDKTLNATFEIYRSPFGTYKLVNTRFLRNSVVVLVQPDKWEMPVLRPYKVEELAKTGDADKRMLVTEYSLKALAPSANAIVKDLS